MPVIPTYDPKYGIPALDLPEVSPKAASMVADAAIEATKSGIQALQMSHQAETEKWKAFEFISEKIKGFSEANQVTGVVAGAQKDLNDLKNKTLQDPLWNSNPDEALNVYQAQAQEIISKNSGFILDPKARERLENSMIGLSTSHGNHMADLALKQKLGIEQGRMMTNLQNLGNMAMQAGTEAEFDDNVKWAFGQIDAAVASGALNPEQGVKLRQHWIDNAIKSHAMIDISTDPYAAAQRISQGVGPYKMMDPDERFAVLERANHRIEGIERKQEMEIVKAERESMKQERLLDRKAKEVFRNADDALASIVEFGEEGPVDIEEKLRGIGTEAATELADEYARKKKIAVGTFDVMKNAQGKSFQEQLKYIDEAFRTTHGEQGAREKIQAKEHAIKVVQQGMKRFLDDPAGYVLPMVQESGEKDEQPEKSIDRSIEMQKAMGEGLPGFKPTIFSKNYAKQFTEKWAAMEDPNEKLKFARDLRSFGKYQHQVASELGLGADVMLAMTVDDASPANALNAKTLIQAGGMKESEILGDTKVKNDLKKNMRTRLEGNDIWNALSGAVRMQPMNSNQVRFVREIEQGLLNSAMLYGDTGKAMSILENTYQAINDESLGKLVYPKSYPLSASEMKRSLKMAREGVSGFLSNQRDMLGPMFFDEKMRDLKNGGIWVNDPSGEGFVLLNPTTGLAVTDGRGNRFKVTTDDLIRINKMPQEEFNSLFPAESPRGLFRDRKGNTMIRRPIPKEKAFDTSLNFIFQHEGGYANDPDDPGGETKYGISRASYPDLDIAGLTKKEAGKIYFEDYWRKSGADQIESPELAMIHFDTAVNMGVGAAGKLLESSGGDPQKYLDLRRSRYAAIVEKNPKMKKYMKGWMNRVNDLEGEVIG